MALARTLGIKIGQIRGVSIFAIEMSQIRTLGHFRTEEDRRRIDEYIHKIEEEEKRNTALQPLPDTVTDLCKFDDFSDTPGGYVKLGDLLSKDDKEALEKHWDKIQKSYEKFSAY